MSTPSLAYAMTIPSAFQTAPDGTLVFPLLRGLSLEYTPRPTFSTIVQTATDRSTTRIGLDPYPLWEYDLSFGYVSDDVQYALDDAINNPGGQSEYRQILGLFCACGGMRDTFLMDLAAITKRPSDSQVNNMQIGLGNGAQAAFQLVRNFGGFLDLIDNPVVSTLAVIITNSDGSAGTQTVSSCINGVVTLSAAPDAGAIVSASFRWLHRFRFAQDTDEMDAMWDRMYSRDKLKVVQERNVSV